MKISIVTFFLALALNVEGQSLDTIFFDKMPIRNGFYENVLNDSTASLINYKPGIIIRVASHNRDSVFSVSNGKIISTSRNKNKYSCIIKDSSFIYGYMGLKVKIKLGLFIQRGQYLGKMRRGLKNRSIRIVIYQGGKALENLELIQYLKLVN